MIWRRCRICKCARSFNSDKYRFLLLFIFSALTFLFIIHTILISINQNILLFNCSLPYKRPLHLLSKEKILLPISVNRLYDYRVVCIGNNGILSRNELINKMSTICGINLNRSLTINFNLPYDFQIRSLSSSKYDKLWKKTNTCTLFQNETIAIVISYRDREKNLKILLYNLIPFLQRQNILNYKIFIIEQRTLGAFNKGRLYNIAFHYLMKMYKPTCVIFHGNKTEFFFSNFKFYRYFSVI